MSTATINATSAYYHLTPVGNDARTQWFSGGPRKGISNNQREIGMIIFSMSEIYSAVHNYTVPSAKLVLNRDTAYGSGTVDISIVPISTEAAPQANTYAEAMSRAQRRFHYTTTVSGDTSEIDIPGYWIAMMQAEQFAGVIIYKEIGEGTESEARFTATASLKITQGATWHDPVWMREIGQGDIISDETHSLKGDMAELMHYINVRLTVDELSGIDFSGLTNGLYKDWPAVVTRMQAAISNGAATSIYGKEGKTAIVWKTVGSISSPHSDNNIILPNADIMNQLRNALEAPISNHDTTETLAVTQYARTYFEHYDSDFTVNLNELTTWSAKGPWSGMLYEYVMDNGQKKKKYVRRFGFWLLNNITAGKTVNKAKIRLTRTEGASGVQTINLYPVKISSLPNAKMRVSNVMDTSIIVGTATAAIGQTVEIELSDAFRTALGTTYYGVGVDDHQQYTNYGTSATLIINYS